MARDIDVGKGLTVVISATVMLLLVGTVLASGIGAFNAPDSSTFEMNDTETVNLEGDLNATLDSTDDTAGTATVTLEDSAVNESQTVTVDEGANATATIDGEEIVVTADTVNNGSATLTFEVPTTYGWADGASSIFGILDLIVMLTVFLLLIGWVTKSWY